MTIYHSKDKPYCVYLTTYLGNKLPPFYIGSTSISKVHNGYCGSVSSKKWRTIWKQELKENPQFFKITIVFMTNTRKEAYEKEKYFQLKLNVVKSDMYINDSLADGTFTNFGKKHSPEAKKKMSIAAKGKKKGKQSQEHIKKRTAHRIGQPGKTKGLKHTPETIEKMKLKAVGRNKGIIPWNKGKKNVFSEEVIEKMKKAKLLNSLKGRSYEEIHGKEKVAELKQKRSQTFKGKPKTIEHKKKLSLSAKKRNKDKIK